MMKRLGLLFFVAILALPMISGCVNGLTGERGNGHVVSEERNVKDFKTLEFSGGMDVMLVKSDSRSVKVITDENLLDNVETFVRGETLIVKSRHIGEVTELKVVVHFHDIQKIEMSGAVNVISDDLIATDSFYARLNGASELRLNLKVKQLELDCSGASNLYLSGFAEEMTFESSGASELHAYDLETHHCDLDISGASEAQVYAVKSLSVSASGASDVYYKGDPERISQHVSGASSLHQR